MSIEDKMDIPATWGKFDVHDKMWHIGEKEENAQYDLVQDVWDIVGDQPIDRKTFEMILNQAIETFLGYSSIKEYHDEREDRY